MEKLKGTLKLEAVKAMKGEDLRSAYPNTEKKKKGERKTRSRLARQRIGKFLTSSFTEKAQTDSLPVEYQVLRLYGFEEKELSETSMFAAHQQAFSLIAEDLLWAEFYDPRGSLSGFAERNYEKANPDEFKVLPVTWKGAEEILQNHLENQGWGEEDDLEGMVAIEMEFDEDYKIDLVAEYARFFGRDKIIALPFTIAFNKNSVSLELQRDFIEPYGGAHTGRLIYIKKDFNADSRAV